MPADDEDGAWPAAEAATNIDNANAAEHLLID